MSGVEGMDLCVRCKARLGFFREDAQGLCLCTECWQSTDPTAIEFEAVETYGDEQYDEGVQNGWTQAMNALEEYIEKHPKATAQAALLKLDTRK